MDIEKVKQKIKEIEDEIQSLPYHKGTEHHIGGLKAKLAKLREETIGVQKGGKKGGGFAVRKQGDATVVLIGIPSVGKSTLLNKLTSAQSKVGFYPFTTLDVIPGMLEYKSAKIQIFDVPGLISGAAIGKGGGKEILSVVRVADLLLLIASAENPETFEIMEKELYSAGVRINQKPPPVSIEKRLRGGIEILSKPNMLSKESINALAKEFKIPNAKISFRGKINQDQLIDAFMGNRAYAPAIKVISKIDLLTPKTLKILSEKIGKDCLLVSAKKNIGIERLKQTIFNKLKLIRIYLRPEPQSQAEKKPLICKQGITVLGAAQMISGELAEQIKGARINGPSALHHNQLVGLKHQLQDSDQVFFVR